jgi:hypothetical protein
MIRDIESQYAFAKSVVVQNGFAPEISWQSKVRLEDLTESTFLREFAWVVLSTGFKETIVRNVFQNISECFFNWKSALSIVSHKTTCFRDAMQHFRNTSKISAIIDAADRVELLSFPVLKRRIIENPISTLRSFSFIGPVTVYHLAKNIGVAVAKPDRHLIRIANSAGFTDVQEFCNEIANLTGDSISVIDIVFWRFATLKRDYIHILFEGDESGENSAYVTQDTYRKG